MAVTIIITLALIAIIIVQIGKLIELSSAIRGEKEARQEANNRNAWGSLIFMVVFLVGSVWSAYHYGDMMLGYGPNVAASEHGPILDQTFNITLFFTGIVFIVTQIGLFWFSYKYREQEGRTALYMPHDNRLEIIWTAVPAVVMTFLVINGLDTWNTVMADIGPDEVAGEDYIEIEATGYQWAWIIRYPGADNNLGARDFKLTNSANNPLGQDWNDKKNLDDFHPDKIVLPVGKKVRVRITARDVLHNFYLPHFRLKMDAVPGMPTYFVFTPTKTTAEYRNIIKDNPAYQIPTDPTDPESKMKWEDFEYELACAELCGKGHYSMRRVVEIVTEKEYEDWLKSQKSYYETTIKGKEGIDPYYESASEEDAGEATKNEEGAEGEAANADDHGEGEH
jgi:cytochrome c oxidase subunit 2